MAGAVDIVPLVIGDLSEVKLDGKGAFDVLMSAANLHVERQFTENRIKGQDYAQVYLTAMQYVLQNSVQFLLNKDQAANQAALTKAQLLLVEAELDRQELQKQLVQAEVDKTAAEICLLKAQYDLTMLQKLQTTAQTSLVQQKIATEKAQTIATGVDDNSVIGKQKLLYGAQTDGFKRDAEQKAAKMLIDTWNVRRTTDEGTVADDTNRLSDATIGRAVEKVMAGIGA